MVGRQLKVSLILTDHSNAVRHFLQGGRHIIAQEEEKHTPQELQLMKTQDIKYIQMKIAAEKKAWCVLEVSFLFHVLL